MSEKKEPQGDRNLALLGAAVLTSGLGIGFLPLCPGTFASLLPALFAASALQGGASRAFVAAVLFLLLVVFGLATALFGGQAERRARVQDPRHVVSDEIAGQSLALLPACDLASCLLGFVLFRFLDVVKPWPVKSFEAIGGGLGILADDLAAGALSALGLVAYTYLFV